MDKKNLIGYDEALGYVLDRINPLSTEAIPLGEGTDRVLSEDLYARVDSPSVNASLKDGYAIRSSDIDRAGDAESVCLKVIDTAAAGIPANAAVQKGTAVRVLTGARLPEGADAVLPDEWSVREGDAVTLKGKTEPGRNILPRGFDVSEGQPVMNRGDLITPGMAGLLAASGYGEIPVFRRLRVGIIATGDEVVAPGRPLPEGKLFASNMVTLNAWCRKYLMQTFTDVVPDDWDAIRMKLAEAMDAYDAVITSGGAWLGDRDMVSKILNDLGWEQVFHRARLGPGKAVGFGIYQDKPVFILPGGPPSNLIAFLEIALPGLLKLAGYTRPSLPKIIVSLQEPLTGMKEWTQFIFGRIDVVHDRAAFVSLKGKSRLRSMAEADAIICIPEGVECLPKDAEVAAQVLF